MKPKKAVITGGAGFIGSHLVKFLGIKGFDVVSISSRDPAQKKRNVTYLSGDIRDLSFMRKACKGAGVIFHCAAKGNMTESFSNPYLYHDVNVNGTALTLEAARMEGIEKIIYFSSAMCYGIPSKTPTPETVRLNPTNPYATSKVMAERLLLDWSGYFHIPTISLRLSLVYGPRMSKTNGTIFSILFPQRLYNLPLTVCGDGNQKRDFVHVDDVCRAAFAAFESSLDGRTFNIGGGVAYTINDLIKLIGGANVLRVQDPRVVPNHLELDITQAKELLHWEPKVRLSDGIQEMLEDIHYWNDETPLTPLDVQNRMNGWKQR